MQKNNIVIISLDAVRADHLSLYGYSRDTMPFLQEFSKESVLCENAYSSSNWTLPSHVSMVTGSPMSQHGIGSDKTRLRKISDPRLVTLAEYLRSIGYQTSAFTNSVYLSSETLFDRGFMNFHWMGELIGRSHPFYTSRVLGKYWGRKLNKIYTDRIYEKRDQGAYKTYRNYQTWLRHVRKDGVPFFSFIHLFESHAPYWVPEPFRNNFGDVRKSDYLWIRENVNPWFHITGERTLSSEKLEILKDLYDGTLLYLDDIVNRIIDELKSLSILDQTIVIITSDHGECFGEHNSLGHAGETLYEPVIKIPLIIRLPENMKHTRISEPVSHLDLFPTILGNLGHSPDYLDRQLQGVDLLNNDDLENLQERTVLSESLTVPLKGIQEIAPNYDIDKLKKYLRALRWKEYKFVWSTNGEHQLFNLNDDADELMNLFDPSEKLSQSFIQKMEEWLSSYQPYDMFEEQSRNISDPAMIERLRELGYLE